jgi:carboxyvinyl-carboxyphosphonate phosphorylmutase
MHWTQRRARYRAHLSGNRCVYPASVFDVISARIAEDIGFEIGMFAGSTASLTILGAPDLVVLTLSEFAAQAYRICRAGDLPVMVDADHGYGNALNVRRTIEELETAGICGATIEDTLLPLPFGSADRPQVLSIAESVGKMRAALAGRQDPNFAVIGRTSAMGITGLDDVIARAKAYEAVGVDAFFMSHVRTRAQLEAVSQAVTLPLLLGTIPAELADLDYLSAQRVKVCVQGHMPIAASIQAVYATMKALREGTKPKDIENLPEPGLMKKVTRDADYQRWIKDFLS